MRPRVLAWVGLALSAALLTLLLWRVDAAAFVEGLRRVRLFWVLAVLVAVATAMAVRALRWQVLAAASGRKTYAAYWDSVNVMYFGNALYPGRVGEIMRIWSIHRWVGLPAGPAASTAVADRLADVFMIGLAAVWAIAHLGADKINVASYLVVAAFIMLPLMSLVALRQAQRIGVWVSRLAVHLPGSLPERMPRWYTQAHQSAQILRNPTLLLRVWLLSAIAVGLDYLAFYSGVLAMGWQLPFEAAVLVGVLVATGMLVPSAPSALGIYQLACVFALRQYGVTEAEAVVYSFVVQLGSLVVVLLQTVATGLRRGAGFLQARQEPETKNVSHT